MIRYRKIFRQVGLALSGLASRGATGAVGVRVLAISLLANVATAQIPSNPVAFDGGFQGTVRFLIFSAFGNNQHATASCFIDVTCSP